MHLSVCARQPGRQMFEFRLSRGVLQAVRCHTQVRSLEPEAGWLLWASSPSEGRRSRCSNI